MYNKLCFAGKSNSMDAISFVLGEKTSNLRVKRLSVSNEISGISCLILILVSVTWLIDNVVVIGRYLIIQNLVVTDSFNFS